MSNEQLEQFQRVFRATGYLTNNQAWDVAELVVMVRDGAAVDVLLARAEEMRKETFGE